MSAILLLDRTSLLALASGTSTLDAFETSLRAERLTLDLSTISDVTVSEWLAHGAPGARSRWLDPADHLIAGFEGRLRDGRLVHVKAAPRRAVGPDLLALFFGQKERFGTITNVWLRVHEVNVARGKTASFEHRDPESGQEEEKLWDDIARELSHSVSKTK